MTTWCFGPSKRCCVTAKSERRIEVCRTGDLSDNVVALTEEGVPIVQDALLFVVQIEPLGRDVGRLGGGFREGPGCIVTGEDCSGIN